MMFWKRHNKAIETSKKWLPGVQEERVRDE